MEINDEKDLLAFGQKLINELNNELYPRLELALLKNPGIRETLNPAFPFPKAVRIGLLDNCLAVEHIGPEEKNNPNLDATAIWRPGMDLYEFLDIEIDHLNPQKIPWKENIENRTFYFGDAIQALTEYKYDFKIDTNKSNNLFFDFSNSAEPIYLSNVTYIWTDVNGELRTRHIDFLEIFPAIEEGWPYHGDLAHFANFLLQHEVTKFDVKLHKVLNEFIKLIQLSNTSEPAITKFLSDNPELLRLCFSAKELNPQVKLEWQYNSAYDDLIPDFLPEGMDGYCDILEFKLPKLRSAPMVGSESRKQASFEVDSAIAQVDLYNKWCEQDVNVSWLETEKKIKISNPTLKIVMGHSKDFTAADRQKLSKSRNARIHTYDELIEMIRYLVYQR